MYRFLLAADDTNCGNIIILKLSFCLGSLYFKGS